MLEAIIWYDKNVLARLRATVKTTKGGGCVDKYKRLVSNTLLFAISTFSSTILSFFLTAYRTRVMGAADYGGMDAIVTIGNFFIPLVSLGIANAIIRFGLEKGVNKRQLYTNGLLSIFAGFLLLCALAPVLNLVPFVRDTVQGHWMWLLLFVLVSCLRTLNCQFVRARNLVRLYALDGILCTLTNLLFNVLFLSGLNLGAQGWILALICSDACSALFLFFVSSIWRYMGGRINTKLWRKMLVYSVPLISASIFWTVTNTSDKLFITAMLGAEWNGLFAACYQLPTLLTVVATLFTEAWQLSAFTDGTRAGREEFFGKVFGAYQGLMFLAGAGIIWLCRPIMSIYVADEYYLGWIFIPVLTFATIFSSFDNFLNSIYMVEKRSGLSLLTMGVGAVMNLILNALLIPIWGVQGAAIATFASYFLVFLVRAYNTRTLIEVDFSPELLALNFGLVVLEAALCIKEVPGSYVWNGIIVLIIAVVNLRGLVETCLRFLHRR